MERLASLARHVVTCGGPVAAVTAAAAVAVGSVAAATSPTPTAAAPAAAEAAPLKLVFLPDSPGEDPKYLFPSLREAFPSATFVFPATADEAAEELRDADAAMGQLRPRVLAAAGGAPRLKLLQSPQAAPPAGFYFEELARHPCRVSNMRGTFNDQLPLHVLTMMLTLNRNFHIYRDQQAARVYQQVPDHAALDSSSTAVVVGVGAAGTEIARLCKQVFGMRVVGVDSGRASASECEWVDSLHGQEELDAVLGQGDVVVVTIPHTPETEQLFDASKFELMRSDALFINIVSDRPDVAPCLPLPSGPLTTVCLAVSGRGEGAR
jgi:lactate dehydrogenase-like 2-hydroxyacid dehydrogenase